VNELRLGARAPNRRRGVSRLPNLGRPGVCVNACATATAAVVVHPARRPFFFVGGLELDEDPPGEAKPSPCLTIRPTVHTGPSFDGRAGPPALHHSAIQQRSHARTSRAARVAQPTRHVTPSFISAGPPTQTPRCSWGPRDLVRSSWVTASPATRLHMRCYWCSRNERSCACASQFVCENFVPLEIIIIVGTNVGPGWLSPHKQKQKKYLYSGSWASRFHTRPVLRKINICVRRQPNICWFSLSKIYLFV
jgi:hypothetical protein